MAKVVMIPRRGIWKESTELKVTRSGCSALSLPSEEYDNVHFDAIPPHTRFEIHNSSTFQDPQYIESTSAEFILSDLRFVKDVEAFSGLVTLRALFDNSMMSTSLVSVAGGRSSQEHRIRHDIDPTGEWAKRVCVEPEASGGTWLGTCVAKGGAEAGEPGEPSWANVTYHLAD